MTINQSYDTTLLDTICATELPFEWNGLIFDSTSTLTLFENSTSNCDSNITHNLYVNNNPYLELNIGDTTICEDSAIFIDAIGNNINLVWSNNISDSSFYYPNSDELISVTATDDNNCSTTSSANITIESCIPRKIPDFENLPNIFTPNNDGINDTFYIPGNCLEIKNVSIYNRWGQKIYQSESGNYWNGRLNSGNLAPDGIYYYNFDLESFENGEYIQRKVEGFLSLNSDNTK